MILCFQLLQNKYSKSKSFKQCEFNNGSQFWKGVLEREEGGGGVRLIWGSLLALKMVRIPGL